LEKGKVFVRATQCLGFTPESLPELGEEEVKPIRGFSSVWIRRDPPFDSAYLSLCWLLALEEKHTLFVNRPSVLVRYHEKLLPFEAMAQGFLKATDLVPTHIGDAASARSFLQVGAWKEAIRKPFFGFGGSDVKRFSVESGGALPRENELELTQPFLTEVTRIGDRRIFFLGGKQIGDFVRMPKQGDFVSNIAHGGSGHCIAMKKAEKEVASRLGKFLKKAGIDFAGADMIGSKVSEVNITSPTGIRSYAGISGIDLAPQILDYIERKAQ
jgi:glutathione synthase